MRRLATAARIRTFVRRLAPSATTATTLYITGGATAVLLGWRDATVDLDIKLVPDDGSVLRGVPPLKEALEINVELASPDLFLPVRAGWEDRSPWETSSGYLVVRHFDLTAQALGKLERAHARDLIDVAEMFRRGYVTPASLRRELDAIEEDLYRFPAVNPPTLHHAVAEAIRRWG